MPAITAGASGCSLSCSARKAMRSRRASALRACGASYSLKRLGSLNRCVLARALGRQKFLLCSVLQKHFGRRCVGDELAGIEPGVLGGEGVELLRADFLAVLLVFR